MRWFSRPQGTDPPPWAPSAPMSSIVIRPRWARYVTAAGGPSLLPTVSHPAMDSCLDLVYSVDLQ